MIDIEKAKKAFKEYLIPYDQTNDRIALKIVHTYGVVKCSEYISNKLGLDEEQTNLAMIIALLHDIGRFEQLKKYDNFDDRIMNHAEFGVKVLFEDNLIRSFIQDKKYDKVIYKAILNHNKYKADYENSSEQEILQMNIIRDADKMDNFRVKSDEEFEVLFKINENTLNNERITDEIYNYFINCELVNNTFRKTHLDFWISYIAFIFDFNFIQSLEWIKEKNYIDILIDRIHPNDDKTREKMLNIRQIAKEYINNKLALI